MAENENTKDPATGLPLDYRHMLGEIERVLIEQRDQAIRWGERGGTLKDYHDGERDAFQRAIGAMHIVTRGAFGQLGEDQAGGQQ
jgi:hypothetical protein